MTVKRWRRWCCLVALVLTMISAGCSGGSNSFTGPAPLRGGPAVTYVALGEEVASTVTDPRLSWQDLFVQSALPYWATSYVVAVPGDWQTEPAAIVRQVSALRATVVSVDVGVVEAGAGEEVGGFSASLRQLLDDLEKAHIPRVLVANLPPVVASSSQAAAYDSAIAADSRASGAVLVDVHGVLARARAAGKVVKEGSSLTPLGEKLIAGAFGALTPRVAGLIGPDGGFRHSFVAS